MQNSIKTLINDYAAGYGWDSDTMLDILCEFLQQETSEATQDTLRQHLRSLAQEPAPHTQTSR